MLFSSFEFIFVFLPITAAVFWLVAKAKFRYAYFLSMAWLVLASLFFYGWWNPQNLWLILFSIVFNYFVGRSLSNTSFSQRKRKLLLGLGILVNLLLLGYFKYLNFFVDNINHLSNLNLEVAQKVLPLAISFFTFQQIGYLVDAYRRETERYKFSEYLLFVSFFPQLIAGPIVHHKELIPQFSKSKESRLNSQNVAVGTTIFLIGLSKKLIFADIIARNANIVFSDAAIGVFPDFFNAWIGALSYTLQLYFDFSGYSDMAIGAACLFGIQLPINFNSPYKATSIVDFWRRWHITLSNFLRDYLYIPLGGNRKGNVRRSVNLMLTMLLGGLWHGAGWTFVIWGGLHGLYLVINNQWNALKKRTGINNGEDSWFVQRLAQLLTFLAVVVSWVFFRAQDTDTAIAILQSMAGGHGFVMPMSIANLLGPAKPLIESWQVTLSSDSAFDFAMTWLHISALLGVVWLAPNTQTLLADYVSKAHVSKAESMEPKDLAEHTPNLDAKPARKPAWELVWRPTPVHAIICGIMLFVSTKYMLAAPGSEFLYFNF